MKSTYDKIYIIAVITDLNGKPCTESGMGGIFPVDNRLSYANKVLTGDKIISAYKKNKSHVQGFILSTLRNKPVYVNSFYRV